MRPVHISFILFMLFFSFRAAAQSVSGKVVDESGAPMPSAVIYDHVQKVATSSGPEGRYTLQLKPGKHLLEVYYAGYSRQSKAITLKEGEKLEVNFQLKPAPLLLESVGISAVRASSDAPIAESTLTKKEIDQLYVGEDAQFLLQNLSPSIVSYSESGSGFSNYGGMRLRGIDQTRINITLNGVPLNDMLDQGVFFSNFTDFANSVASVQVQRGVGFSSNGTASFAGSINFESEKIFIDTPKTEIQVNGGSFSTLRGSAELYSGTLDDRFAFYGRMSSFTTNGYRYHSGSESWSMFFSGGYRNGKDLFKITAFNGRTKNHLAYFPVPLPLIRQDPRTNINFEQDRDDFGQNFVQLFYARALSKSTTVNSTLYYNGAGGDFPFGYGDSLGQFAGQINYPLQNRHFGFFGNIHFESGKSRVKTGVHGYLFNRRNWETLLPDNVNTIYDDRSQKKEISGFVNFAHDLLPRLRAFADLQVRYAVMSFTPDYRYLPRNVNIPLYPYFFVNPKAGFRYQIKKNTDTYFSFARTGREPTKFDIFGGTTRLDSSNLAAVQNRETVLPEYVNDFEAGVRHYGKRLSWNVNLFWMDFRNKIEPIGERLIWVQLRKNVPRSFRRGIEMEGKWSLDNGFYTSGMLSLIDARIKEYDPDNDGQNIVYRNVRPALTPGVLGSLQAGKRFAQKVDISIAGQYTGAMFIEPTNRPGMTIPASLIFDARVLFKPVQHMELSLKAGNVFNTLYYRYGEVGYYQGEEVPAYFVEAPRNFNLLLRWVF